MRSWGAALATVVLAAALGGCVGDRQTGEEENAHDAHAPDEVHQLTVWGVVTNDAFQPLARATVRAANGANATSNDTGGYELALSLAMGDALLLTASAPGHQATSARVTSHNESRMRVDFRLPAAPSDEPFEETVELGGNLACGVLAGAGHSHDPEGPPTTVEHDCGANDPNNRRTFTVDVGPRAHGLLLELQWDARTDLARQMEMGLTIGDVTAGWAAGFSVLRVALGAASLEPVADGGTVRIVVQVASMSEGEESDVALGAAFQQPFMLYATVFYGGEMDEDFTAVPE